jgi:hypothetical protein
MPPYYYIRYKFDDIHVDDFCILDKELNLITWWQKQNDQYVIIKHEMNFHLQQDKPWILIIHSRM